MMRWLPNDSADHAGYNFSFSYDIENWIIENDIYTIGTSEDQQFYQTYLKSEFLADSAESFQLIGENGTFFEDSTVTCVSVSFYLRRDR